MLPAHGASISTGFTLPDEMIAGKLLCFLSSSRQQVLRNGAYPRIIFNG
jgi:hypothetical protein